jgi:hypothetical protein
MTGQRTRPIIRGRLTGLGLLDSLDLGIVLAYPLEFGRDLVIRWIMALHLEVDYVLYQRRVKTMRWDASGSTTRRLGRVSLSWIVERLIATRDGGKMTE